MTNEEEQDEEVDRKRKWDCESIISTYSNIHNHPKVINGASKKRKKETKEMSEVYIYIFMQI